MSNPFFDHPILNSPYVRPLRYWELDADGQPTQKIIETRRRAEFITPIPKPKTRKGSADQQKMVFDEGRGLSDANRRHLASVLRQGRKTRILTPVWESSGESRDKIHRGVFMFKMSRRGLRSEERRV